MCQHREGLRDMERANPGGAWNRGPAMGQSRVSGRERGDRVLLPLLLQAKGGENLDRSIAEQRPTPNSSRRMERTGEWPSPSGQVQPQAEQNPAVKSTLCEAISRARAQSPDRVLSCWKSIGETGVPSGPPLRAIVCVRETPLLCESSDLDQQQWCKHSRV